MTQTREDIRDAMSRLEMALGYAETAEKIADSCARYGELEAQL